jgi:hypothetical protein
VRIVVMDVIDQPGDRDDFKTVRVTRDTETPNNDVVSAEDRTSFNSRYAHRRNDSRFYGPTAARRGNELIRAPSRGEVDRVGG